MKTKEPETEINKNKTSKKSKFDPKKYQSKQRVYRPVPGASRISKLYLWNTEQKEYLVPDSCKTYMARRYEPDQKQVLTRKTQFFETLDEARKWQAGIEKRLEAPSAEVTLTPSGPKLSDVVTTWKKRTFPCLAHGTRLQYEKLLRLHLCSILNLHIPEITPKRVDLWLDQLRETAVLNVQRKTLNHELTLLSTLLRFYLEEEDDLQFHFPIKARHWKSCLLHKKKKLSSKDFTREEFLRFREALQSGPHGPIMASLATVQYFQALRISEAAAIFCEDIRLMEKDHSKTRLMIRRSICWPRTTGNPSYVQTGFKNSNSFDDGVKEQPVFPEAYAALVKALNQSPARKTGLIFELDGSHLEYRQIQHAYDVAFKKAELPYSGTHVLRHGGCRNLYNESGDLSVAQQLLGDKSEQATKVYARRKASALTEVANEHWLEKAANDVETGCNWLREPVENKKPVVYLRVIK